jgi:hypothetical protein
LALRNFFVFINLDDFLAEVKGVGFHLDSHVKSPLLYLGYSRNAIAAVKIETFVHGDDGSHTGWARANRRLIFQFVPVYGTATAIPAFLR